MISGPGNSVDHAIGESATSLKGAVSCKTDFGDEVVHWAKEFLDANKMLGQVPTIEQMIVYVLDHMDGASERDIPEISKILSLDTADNYLSLLEVMAKGTGLNCPTCESENLTEISHLIRTCNDCGECGLVDDFLPRFTLA
jgi:peptide subunit release factor 1 (eRF1)